MNFLHSLRWRVQLWHGVLLILVLAGFGFTAWNKQRAEQLQRVDRELEPRIAAVIDLLRPTSPSRAPRPRDDRPEGDPLRDRLQIPERARDRQRPASDGPGAFESGAGQPFYYLTWQADGRRGVASPSAPAEIARPELRPGPATFRQRGSLRECVSFTATGDCVLVGRDIGAELAEINRSAWWLTGAGGVVLVLGLAGGWWVVSRTLRPVAAISATAKKIAAGDLTQRIQSPDQASELGLLVRDLNHTFAQLQAGFDRQVQFTSDASHELRTPVAVVLTQTQMTLARERSAAEYRESLVACQRAAQRMRGLIEGLLTLARLDSAPGSVVRAACDLGRVASDAVELLRPLASAQDIQLQTDAAPASCWANSDQLAQVATNLIGNAIAYNRPGGRVRVTTMTEPGHALLVVADTGPGIAAADLTHIFDRFYRADKARSGDNGHSGLGLAISRAIVEAHGGTLTVASILGEGCTFTVRLPVVCAEGAACSAGQPG